MSSVTHIIKNLQTELKKATTKKSVITDDVAKNIRLAIYNLELNCPRRASQFLSKAVNVLEDKDKDKTMIKKLSTVITSIDSVLVNRVITDDEFESQTSDHELDDDLH
jgi:hypothetical protein